MASSSARPHRQARSGVSYRDPHYDYEDDISFSRRPRSPSSPAISRKGKDSEHLAKKNLALKPAKKRATAKERAEAVQLQRAINESLSQRSPKTNVHLPRAVHESLSEYEATYRATSVLNHENSAVNCMDEHDMETLSSVERTAMNCVNETAQNDCLAFQCLLDVATEAVLETINLGDSEDTKQTSFIEQNEEYQALKPSIGILQVEILQKGEMLNKSTSKETNYEVGKSEDYLQDKIKEQNCLHDGGNSDSFNDWDKGSSEQADTENESSDLSDESGCQRRRPVRLQQNASNNTVKDNVVLVQVKKARSARSLLRVKTLPFKSSHTLVSTPCKPSLKAPCGKENILTNTSMGSTRNTASNMKEQTAAEKASAKKSDQSMENFQSWELHKSKALDLTSAGQQGTWSLPLQSPTLVHRRVLGLSRRHRPPPLHPYLASRDG